MKNINFKEIELYNRRRLFFHIKKICETEKITGNLTSEINFDSTDMRIRIPVIFVLDKSLSAKKYGCQLEEFVNKILSHILSISSSDKYVVDFSVVSFGDSVIIEENFKTLNSDYKYRANSIKSNYSAIGTALLVALNNVNKRVATYQERGISKKGSIFIFVSDFDDNNPYVVKYKNDEFFFEQIFDEAIEYLFETNLSTNFLPIVLGAEKNKLIENLKQKHLTHYFIEDVESITKLLSNMINESDTAFDNTKSADYLNNHLQ